jgi:hypothetical protein
MNNKKFKQLATEAGLLTYNPTGEHTKLEKFAEFILRDAIRQIERTGVLEQDSQAHMYVDTLRDYFDVF